MAYHHFESPQLVTRALAKLLSPGGTLSVVDNIAQVRLSAVSNAEHQLPQAAIPHRMGFTKEVMCGMFESA
jgi:2-polyprenyl-3-methyl-5-hydroxy-6-metoxy-1,4-benzoquinol methylase